MTSRGLAEKDFDVVAGFIDRAVKIALDIQSQGKTKKADFEAAAADSAAVQDLRRDVEAFSEQFDVIGQ